MITSLQDILLLPLRVASSAARTAYLQCVPHSEVSSSPPSSRATMRGPRQWSSLTQCRACLRRHPCPCLFRPLEAMLNKIFRRILQSRGKRKRADGNNFFQFDRFVLSSKSETLIIIIYFFVSRNLIFVLLTVLRMLELKNFLYNVTELFNYR